MLILQGLFSLTLCFAQKTAVEAAKSELREFIRVTATSVVSEVSGSALLASLSSAPLTLSPPTLRALGALEEVCHCFFCVCLCHALVSLRSFACSELLQCWTELGLVT